MANKIKNEIELLFKTKLDEKSKQEIGKNLKDLLGNAAISFNEAETRKNVQPIIQMLKKMFDKAELSFDADELFNMPSDKALQKLAQISADKFQTAFDRALAKSGGVKIDFGDIDLSSMTEPLKEIAEELSEINQKIVNDTKKSVDDIESTIKRLNKIKPKKINTKVTVDGVDQKVVEEVSKVEETIGKIEKTLDASNNPKALTTEKGAINTLNKARNEYIKSFEKGDPWEIQYQHMVTFVSKYEAMTKKIKPLIDTNNPEFAQLYELLSPKAGAAKISLEHFVDVARGNELSEYKNQPWARESTLKKIEQTLKNGISVKDGGEDNKNDEPPKSTPANDSGGDKGRKLNTKAPPDDGESEAAKEARLAREREEEQLRLAEKRRKEEEKITKAIKERKPYVAYRAVESPEDSGKSKRDAIDDFGGEYWSTTREAAESYANNHYGTSSLISAQIKPVNPLIIDANELQWNDFENIPGLKEFFPGLLDVIRESKFPDDEAQKYINEQARLAGFDSVIFKNVQDNFDADLNEDAPITDTIAVLDDRIVSLTGAFTELEETTPSGNKMFSETRSDVPEFYIPPEDTTSEQYLSELREKQAKSQKWYIDTILRLQDTLQQQEEELNAAQRKLNENPKSYTAQESAKKALEAVDATDTLIASLSRMKMVSQKTFQVEIEAFAKTSDVVSEVASDIQEEVVAHQQNAEVIAEEAKAQEKLNYAKAEEQQIDVKDDIHETTTQPSVATVAQDVSGANNAIQTEELKNLLNTITYNVKVIQDSASNDDSKTSVSIDAEELKNVLNSITYNVKIAFDDADKTANKVALDDSILESTLTKVFANILNPETQQNDSKQKQSPWALESTLQAVKGALDNIQTNTSKFGTVEISNVDAIAGTTLESKLTEIKSVLESIDKKIADGGKIFTRDSAKQAYKESQQEDTSKQTARSNMMKSLINDYKTLGKLAAQFMNDGDLGTKAMLENLKDEIARKRQSLKLTMDENASLREKYSIAFDAEKRLLDAERAQAKINKKNKADTKDAEAAWKKQVKDAQRATGINAATSAANAGDQTVLRTIGAEGVSKDIENKAKELSQQIKALRVLRDEIDKKGNEASDKDKDNLSKQIVKVKELKGEIDGYLKIHEKYSGEGVTHLKGVDTSNFGAVGTDQYWNNITAAIKNASTGRVTIKGMNTDTGELTGTTKIAANTFAQWSATVDPITGQLSMLRTGIKRTETLMESITRKTKEIFTYFSGSSIIFKVFNELKKGVQYVRDIDIALTELKKVTDETEETYDKFLETAAKTATKVGSTIKDVVSSTADWARLNI